ncbi:MAG TPA: DUF6119 family protein [Pyrinomonadaceae bacterium]|nr:DUF6119 family protein [Pyrinomonadaceae bacterium]
MDDQIPSRSLTIYLSKDNRRVGSLIKDRDGLTQKMIPVGGGVRGRLLIKPPDGKPPSWASFFSEHVDPNEFGEVSSCSAVLLVPVETRWAAVTFGQGRHLLWPDAFEDRFGLRVALNCIDETKIRSMDKQTFDAIARHTLEQASYEANAGEFGFDIERDMLRAVTGTPRNPDLGKRLTGMDALSAQVQVELNGLFDLLESYHRKFFDKSYQDSFPWVDQISEVSDPALESILNEMVVKMIRDGQVDRCWLAVPDIIDWSIVSGFRYSNANKSPELYDIHLRTYLESLKQPEELSAGRLKSSRAYCMSENDQIIKSWSIFNCLYCELDYDGQSYVLNAGRWYVLEKDFVQQVNDSFSLVPVYSGALLDYNDASEGHYNERLATTNREQYYLMDRNLTYSGGPMEFCDIFSKSKELIHIKRYGGSATLSHLFYQGMASAEFFQTDPKYRAIISRSEKPLSMPFFSRVGIRHAVRRLRGFGYRVSLAKIGVSDDRKKLQKIRPKKSRKS